MKLQIIVETVYNNILRIENKGELPSYISELADVNPNKFGVFISTKDGLSCGQGDYQEKFSLQSVTKILSLTLAFSMEGEKIWKRVGVEPSGTAFNSLIQLEADNGIPRNPFINAGALVICDILISKLDNPKKDFLEFIHKISDNPNLTYSKRVTESERSVGYRNVALCNFIKSFDNIENDPTEVLDFYYNMCSLEMTCEEIAKTCMYFSNGGKKITDGEKILTSSQTKRLNALMQTCGFYDESGEFSFKVGLPGKSGVGGGIIAIHPNEYVLAVWSPRLNKKWNSYRGMRFLEEFTTVSEFSIF